MWGGGEHRIDARIRWCGGEHGIDARIPRRELVPRSTIKNKGQRGGERGAAGEGELEVCGLPFQPH